MNTSSAETAEVSEPTRDASVANRLRTRLITNDTGWRRPLLLAATLVLGARLMLSVWAALVLGYLPTTDLQHQYAHTGVPLQTSGLAAPWQREDALWYEKIATQGYSPTDGTSAFPPLLPALMRLVSVITLGNSALAGILVGSLAAIVALALIYRLTTLDSTPSAAFLSVVYLGLFPTAFFLYSGYTESLFLALAMGAFWLARQGKWPLVALLAGMAGAAKVQGGLLFLPLAFEYIAWSGWSLAALRRHAVEFTAVVVASPLATATFFAYVTYVVGDRLPWNARVNLMWTQRATNWPGETLLVSLQKIINEQMLTINAFDLIVFLSFATLAVGAFRLRVSYGLQAATVLLPSLLRVSAQFPLMSMSRYVLAAFPCFIVLSVWADKRPRPVRLLILVLWVSLLLVWSSQFVRGYWVG